MKQFFPSVFASVNVSDLNFVALEKIEQAGKVIESRNGPAKFIPRAELILTNPRNRYLDLQGRKYNIFQIMAETFWIMSGDNDVSGFLEFFLPRAKDFSDDGKHWRGGYGPRIFNGQFDDALDAFMTDGINTRRSVISIYNPDLDSSNGLMTHFSLAHTKDLPCNDFIQFWADQETKTLHMDVYQRSGDLFWGTGSINLYEFSFLHEIFVEVLNRNGFDLELGTYRHITTNLHYYPEKIGRQAIDILSSGRPTSETDTCGEIFLSKKFEDESDVVAFFRELVEHFTSLITADQKSVPEPMSRIFNKWSINMASTNTLWLVANLVETYIISKRGGKVELPIGLFEYHQPILSSVNNCQFTNFKIV